MDVVLGHPYHRRVSNFSLGKLVGTRCFVKYTTISVITLVK